MAVLLASILVFSTANSGACASCIWLPAYKYTSGLVEPASAEAVYSIPTPQLVES